MKEWEPIRYQPGPPTPPEKILGKVACFASEYGVRPHVEGIENFIQTREHLEKGGSLLGYFNHDSAIDPSKLAELFKKRLGKAIKDWVAPGAYKHFDPERSRFGQIKAWGMRGVAYEMGFELYPVVQSGDKKNYSDDLVAAVNYDFARRALEVLKSPGGVLLIAPEGTRGEDHQLLKAEKIVGRLLEKGKNTVAQPIALIDCGLPRSVIRRPKVVIGPIYSPEQVREVAEEKGLETMGDALMVLLAQLLPKEYHGVYAQYC